MSNRRQFFSSIFGSGAKKGGSNEPFYPLLPWYLESKADECMICDDKPCKDICVEGVIILTTEGKPRLNLSTRGCTFCGDCVKACQKECFGVDDTKKINASISIEILACLAWNSTICRSCADVCDEKAIKFLGMFHPEIDSNTCTVCGFCVGVCPSQTIKISKTKEEQV